jgi:ABC-type lipoprotein release transport system permease subunit
MPLLLMLAARNVNLHRSRSMAIAGLLAFGTILVVTGLSILKNIESSMKASIINSVAGHVQVYSSEAKDDLALFGGGFMGREDLGSFADYSAVAKVIHQHPNVQASIPMGFDMAMLARGNELDELFQGLRDVIRAGNLDVLNERIEGIKQQLVYLKRELEQGRRVNANKSEDDANIRLVDEALSDGFWAGLNQDPESKLMHLESKIAPLSGEKPPIYLRYLGTDIQKFRANFGKFKIAEGEAFAPGQRGIIISQKLREDFLKNLPARLLDKLNTRVLVQGFRIADDPESRRLAQDLSRQYMLIMVHLDRGEAAQLELSLRSHLSADGAASLSDLLQRFLVVTDENLAHRHRFFYEEIAPKIQLYEISPGETITLRSYTRSGYVKALPVKVFGVFTFEGIEDSDLVGAFSVIDLVSFRELYGQMNAEGLAELEEMRRNANIKVVDRDNVEDELFGGNAVIESSSQSPNATPQSSDSLQISRAVSDEFPVSEVESGMAINLAIFLKDPGRIQQTIEDLSSQLDAAGIGAKVVDWQSASGIVGQFVVIVRGVLLVSVALIMLVALIIINNTLVVSVLNRTKEIGTMRAIGAQKGFVIDLFLAETLIVGLIGVMPGMILSVVLLTWLGSTGIPAGTDILRFLFSGPRLFPTIDSVSAAVGPLVIAVLATGSSFYAAYFAAKIRPIEAMQEKE